MKNSRSILQWRLLGLLFLLGTNLSYSQEFINTRKISLSRGDTMVVAGILADVKIDKVSPNVFYYWYTNDQILANQGGYAGNLLHGEYIEYDPSGKLILKGQYDQGVKSGQWIYWYHGGAIREIIEYEAGQLEGKRIRYGDDGRIHYSATYRKDLLHGEMTTVINDTLFHVIYKRGKEKKREPLHVFRVQQ